MYTVYIAKYRKDGVMHDDPICIFDRRSSDLELASFNPLLNLEDSRAGTFTITLPITHFAYDYIVKNVTLVSAYRLDDNPEGRATAKFLKEDLVFEGPVKVIRNEFDKSRRIEAEGFFSFFNDSVQPYEEFFDISLYDFVKKVITNHNERQPLYKQFDINALVVEIDYPETDYSGQKSKKAEFEYVQYDSTMNYLLAIQSNYGGHYILSKHYVGDGTGYIEGVTPPYILKYVRELPKNNNQIIDFGENLLDYISNYDATNLCTAVLPISAMNTNSLSSVGETIFKYGTSEELTANGWVRGSDELSRSCWVKRYPDDSVMAYWYPGRVLQKSKSSTIPGNYTISEAEPTWVGYSVLRYFIQKEDERLYLSTRLNDLGEDEDNEYSGIYVLYAYNGYQNVLSYMQHVSDGFESIKDYELDMSYTDNGKTLYVDHSTIPGELLIAGWNTAAVPLTLKRAKYAYSKDLSVGEDLPITINRDTLLLRLPNDDPENPQYGIWQPPWKYNPIEGYGDVMAYEIQPEDKALLITARSMGSGDGTDYIGDGFWALYDGLDTWSSNQLNFEKLNTEGFTSAINFKIDLQEAENIGAKLLLVGSWGSMIEPKVRAYRKYSDKLQQYLTVSGADVDRYHSNGSEFVISRDLEGLWGHRIEKRLEFSGIEDPNVLLKRSEAYLIDNQWDDISVEASAADLHNINVETEAIDISTQIRVRSYPHNVNQFFNVKSISIDLSNPNNSTYKFTDTSNGQYNGILPVPIVTSSNELRDFKLYGTPYGIGEYDDTTNKYKITIVITNLLYEREGQPIKFEVPVYVDKPLTYPESKVVSYNSLDIDGLITGFIEGLIEITTNETDIATGEYPTVEFKYDKITE